MMGAVSEVAAAEGIGRSRAAVEILILLGLSLGESAVYSVLGIIERLTRNVPLAQQTATLNASATPDRPWLDLAYQLAGIGFGLVPVLLALYLLSRTDPPAGRRIGFDLTRPGFDLSDDHLPEDTVTLVEVPAMAISSSDCRARVAAGKPVWYLVPDGVVQYIAKRGLYRTGGNVTPL